MKSFLQLARFFCLAAISSMAVRGAAAPSIVVSVPDQRLALVENGVPVAQFPVSTSKYGVGDRTGSYATPLGSMEIAAKIGDNAPWAPFSSPVCAPAKFCLPTLRDAIRS